MRGSSLFPFLYFPFLFFSFRDRDLGMGMGMGMGMWRLGDRGKVLVECKVCMHAWIVWVLWVP
jgi:hypothetical protein